MRIARWLLPSLIAVALIGVAVVDLVEVLRPQRVPAAPLVELDRVRFEPRDLIVDLRTAGESAGGPISEPRARLVSGWGVVGPSGTWTSGSRAEIDVRLADGGGRALLVQCRPDRRTAPPPWLEVAVNGRPGPALELGRGLAVYRLELEPTDLAAGDNRLELRLAAGRDGRPATGRALLVRRLVITERPDLDFEEITVRQPITVHGAQHTVVIRTPGRLLIDFDISRPGSTLEIGYRFREPPGRPFSIGAGRLFVDADVVDTIGESTVVPDGEGRGTHRQRFGNHTGATRVWITVDARAAADELVVVEPRLIAEPG